MALSGMVSTYNLIYVPSRQVIAASVRQARGWYERGVGFLGRVGLDDGEGLWLPDVSSIHTLGMRFSIDCLFLNADYVCTGYRTNLRSGRVALGSSGTSHTLELATGTLEQIKELKVGDAFNLLQMSENTSP